MQFFKCFLIATTASLDLRGSVLRVIDSFSSPANEVRSDYRHNNSHQYGDRSGLSDYGNQNHYNNHNKYGNGGDRSHQGNYGDHDNQNKHRGYGNRPNQGSHNYGRNFNYGGCREGTMFCDYQSGGFKTCAQGQFVLRQCGPGTRCQQHGQDNVICNYA